MSGAPTLLAFDTSGPWCAAALVMGDRVVAARREEMAKGQAERLFPMLEEVLGEARLDWSDLDALGVGTGPGNFTGIRIAVAAARGLALSLGVPAVGVTAFEIARSALAGEGEAGVVRLPAPRGLSYEQAFGPEGAGAPTLAEAAGQTDGPVPDLAERLARLAVRRLGREPHHGRPAPLYVRPADAAPSSDLPPAILP